MKFCILNIKLNQILLAAIIFLWLPAFAQKNLTQESSKTSDQKVKKANRDASFHTFSASALIATWEETAAVEVDRQVTKTNAIIFGRGLGLDYEFRFGRWGTGLFLQALNGQTDLIPVRGAVFPRRFWYGLNSGPKLIYRLSREIETAHNLGISYKKIDQIGNSYSLLYSIDLRMYLRPRFLVVQSFGVTGLKTSALFSTGLRYDF
jgi:hypothetical protein